MSNVVACTLPQLELHGDALSEGRRDERELAGAAEEEQAGTSSLTAPQLGTAARDPEDMKLSEIAEQVRRDREAAKGAHQIQPLTVLQIEQAQGDGGDLAGEGEQMRSGTRPRDAQSRSGLDDPEASPVHESQG